MLNPDFQTTLTDWIIATVARHAPDAGHRSMYGGLVFERELGTPKTCVCGIYAYTEHISMEFTHGAQLADTMGVLEGGGKHRRHIKLRSMGDILAKDVEGYIARAFALGEAA
ncbi:MAG: DUF1801 domain-containing protein [Cypionkella sp.]|nr:DUF1801 domain-containing protein [Cypionkella sp.]